MDSPTIAYLYLLLVWYVVPTLLTFFATFLCERMGIPVWCPWVVLAAYVHQSQSILIHYVHSVPPMEGGDQ